MFLLLLPIFCKYYSGKAASIGNKKVILKMQRLNSINIGSVYILIYKYNNICIKPIFI
jgi:hypothetical protein